jgi:hypothetical protein
MAQNNRGKSTATTVDMNLFEKILYRESFSENNGNHRDNKYSLNTQRFSGEYAPTMLENNRWSPRYANYGQGQTKYFHITNKQPIAC